MVIELGTAPPGDGRVVFEHGRMIAALPVFLNSERLGCILISSQMEQLNERLSREYQLVAGIGTVALILAIAMALVTQGILSRPILALTKATSRISRQHDFSVRVEDMNVGDELRHSCRRV